MVSFFSQAEEVTTSRAHLESEIESMRENIQKQKQDSKEKL